MRVTRFDSRRTFRSFLILVETLCFLILFCVLTEEARGRTVDRVLATVGGKIITLSEYQEFARGLNEGDGDEVDRELLKKLIEEKIIVKEAERKGLEASNDEVEKMLQEFKNTSGLSGEDLDKFLAERGIGVKHYREMLRENVLVSKLIDADVDAKVIVRDEEIEEAYREHKTSFLATPEEVELKAIFLRLMEDASVTELTDLKRRALKIAALLKDGWSFESLVDEYCDEPLKSQEGILGTFARGTLIPPLDDRAFAMKPGEISDPIWVSEGVYILKLVRRIGETFKPLQEVKGNIYKDLYERKRAKLYNEWIKTLWEKSSVTLNQS